MPITSLIQPRNCLDLDDKLEHILFLFIFRFSFSQTTEHKSRKCRKTTLKIRKCKQIFRNCTNTIRYIQRHVGIQSTCACIHLFSKFRNFELRAHAHVLLLIMTFYRNYISNINKVRTRRTAQNAKEKMRTFWPIRRIAEKKT